MFSRVLQRMLIALIASFSLSPAALAGLNIQSWTLENGARVLLVESHDLPMLDLRIDFPAGSAFEPLGQEGLAAFARSLMEAGTAELDEDAIADRLADTGASLGGGVDGDRAGLSLRTLSAASERDAAIRLAAQILAQPSYPLEALDRERQRSITALREAQTQPAPVAARHFSAAVFPEHPYGRQVSEESLQAIDRAALQIFHQSRYRAGAATITLVGAIDRPAADQIARQLTAALPAGDVDRFLPEPQPTAAQRIQIPQATQQAHILMGMPGMTRDDPDYYPLLVGNYTLGGGGFVSRLTQEVRDARGYAYSVYSSLQPMQVAGPFQIGLQTRGAQTDAAIAVVEQTLASFVRDGPTAEELQAAKDFIINGFGLRLDSNRKILDHVAMIGYYQLPLDWLTSYPQKIEAVSSQSVRDAFTRRIDPQQLVTVIVGGDADQVRAEP